MLTTENGEELVATAGNVDVGSISVVVLQGVLRDPDPHSNRVE